MLTRDQIGDALATGWRWGRAAYEIVLDAAARCTLRVVVWLITIFGALTPVIYAAQVRPSFDYTAMAVKINKDGLFRDLFYVTVVIALIGICEIVTALFKNGKPNNLVGITYLSTFCCFVYLLFYGVTEFAHLVGAHGTIYVAPTDQFEYDLNVLVYAGILGLALEFVLAFRGE